MSWRVKRKVCGDTSSTLDSTAALEDDEDSRSRVRGNLWSRIPQCLSESDNNDNIPSESQSDVDEVTTDLKDLKVVKPKKKKKNRKRANKNVKNKDNATADDSWDFEDVPCSSSQNSEPGAEDSSNGATSNLASRPRDHVYERIQVDKLAKAPEFRRLKILLRLLNPPVPSATKRHTGTRMQLVSGQFLTVLESCSKPVGLLMLMLREEKGLKYFTFKYAGQYAVTHENFKNTPPEENTYHLLEINEFLLENIIKLIGLSTEESTIDKFLDAGLYQIERSLHKDFNLTNLNIRLPYSNIENRSFLILLFLRVVQFGKRGSYRNALEVSKMALNWDHSDPLLFLVMIDYFALESKEFSWFIEFVKEYILYMPIEWMPNILYSMGLAHYRTATASGGDLSAAEFYMKKGLMTYPMILLPLLRKCGLKRTLSQHQELINSKFFSEFDPDLSPVVTKLCELYNKDTFKVWISEKPLKWLLKNGVEVLEMVEKKHPDVEICEKIRKKVQHTLPLSYKRHIFLNKLFTDFTDHSETCPWNPYPPPTARC